MKLLFILTIGVTALCTTPKISANEIAVAKPTSSVGRGASDSTQSAKNSTFKQVGLAAGLIGVATVAVLIGIHNQGNGSSSGASHS